MDIPLISIVLPTYNVSKHIEKCILSCLNQSFKSFELIVVDDCGTDQSIEIANKYALIDSRVKIVSNEKNLGTYHARKYGTLQAIGSYIFFLDPDDELPPNSLDVIHRYLNKYANLDLLLFNVNYVPSLKFWQVIPKVPIGVFNQRAVSNILKESRLSYGTAGKVYARKPLIEGFLSLSIPDNVRLVYGEDALIFASVLEFTKKVVGINERCYIYNRHESSITKATSKVSIDNGIQQLKFIEHYLKELSKKSKKKKQIEVILNKINIDRLHLERSISKNNRQYLQLSIDILIKKPQMRELLALPISYIRYIKNLS